MELGKLNSSLRRLVIMLLAVSPLVLFCAQSAYAATPCCSVTAINSRTGVVTARINATGQIFQFTLKNAAQLRQLRVGQGVYANLSSKTVSLDGRTVVGSIAPVDGNRMGGTQVLPPNGARTASVPPPNAANDTSGITPPETYAPPPPTGACCKITALDNARGLATARVDATGQNFTFRMSNTEQFKRLIVGQGVFASFATNRISFDGQHAVGTITSAPETKGTKVVASAIPPQDVKVSAPNAANDTSGITPPETYAPPPPTGACCKITALDNARGLATARVDATGQNFTFRMSNPEQFKRLIVGQGVFASFATNRISFDGQHAVGTITSVPEKEGAKGSAPILPPSDYR